MRAPKRKRPLKRTIVGQVPENVEEIAAAVRYVGSPEHKTSLSFAGSPVARKDASLCDIRFITLQDQLTAWLQEAIRKGCCSAFDGGSFPRYVWYKDGDTVYEGRLVNRVNGEYKGFPLRKEEWPAGIEDYYG